MKDLSPCWEVCLRRMLTLVSPRRRRSQDFLRKGVDQVSGRDNRVANPELQRRHGLLPQGRELHLGGALPPRPERRQLPASNRTAAVECHRVLYCPWQRLYHRGCRRGHQKAAPGGRAAGGWRLGFHHQAVCILMGQMLQRNLDGMWMYPYLEEAISEADVQEVETYVIGNKNTVAHFIEKRLTMDLCLALVQWPGAWVSNR